MSRTKEIAFWEVTVKCLVRKTDINGKPLTKEAVEKKMSIEFDQCDWSDIETTVS